MFFITEKCRIHAACGVSQTPIKYLSERGLSEVLPPRIPRKERVTYIPYAFSGDEIRSFFTACDIFSRHQGTPRIHIHGWRKISGGYGRKCPMTEQPQRMRSGIIMQQQISTAGSGTGLLLTISSPASAKAWGIRHWRAHGITILSFPAFPISS